VAKRSVIVVVLFIGLVGIWIGGCETQEQKVERLITDLGHKETNVRNNAARALGSIRRRGSRCGACSNTTLARSG
jgi:hypothetical protein